MITLKRLIEKLSEYPSDALAYAYDGEVIGIVSAEKDERGYRDELGFIHATEMEEDDDA